MIWSRPAVVTALFLRDVFVLCFLGVPYMRTISQSETSIDLYMILHIIEWNIYRTWGGGKEQFPVELSQT